MSQNGSEKQKPAVTYRMVGHGTVKLSVWCNDRVDPNTGEVTQQDSITVTKSWKPKDGDWQERKVTMFPEDVDALAILIAKYQADRRVRLEF